MQTARWLEAWWRSGSVTTGTWVTLKGWSMEPVLTDGDLLWVEPLVGRPPPTLGEIVVTRRDSRLVTHRLHDLRGESAVTKGDACRGCDPPVPVQALLGRVVGVKRSLKRFRAWRLLRRVVAKAWRW